MSRVLLGAAFAGLLVSSASAADGHDRDCLAA